MKKKLNNCCECWNRLTDSIEVNPRELFNEHMRYQAQTLQELMKYMMGNFCPMCGNKLRNYKKEKQ